MPLRVILLESCVLILALLSGCAPSDTPARIALRERLTQPVQLSSTEVNQLLDEIKSTTTGSRLRAVSEGVATDLDPDRRNLILSMLTERAGVFDEGLRTGDGITWRVLNGPAASASPEFMATRQLWIDVQTLQPRRFDFHDEGIRDTDFSISLEFER